jgi:aminoglycoside phosphotransferase (APT) family kinase protein
LPFRLRHDQFEGFAGEARPAGIPSEEEYLAAYCRRTGRSGIRQWDFYIAFAMFRLGAIAQGIMGRVLAGTANDPNARDRGQRARPLAEAAWALVEKTSGG